MSRLHALLTQRIRTVAGIMSGTSADGVDVAIARIEGSGLGLHVEVAGHVHVDYAPAFREIVLAHALDRGATVKSISQLNVALSHVYRDAVLEALREVSLDVSQLDLVGCHGQTVQHVPEPEEIGEIRVSSTLQLGDPTVLANLLGIPVVGDFRLSDMTLGGQGAPLVPYFDYVTFSDPSSYRVLLNLGGIANVTFLRPGGKPEDVLAFDTGPANMLIDFLSEDLFGLPMDRDGSLAAAAQPDTEVVSELLEQEYFRRPPPKTTGRELFNDAYAEAICRRFEDAHGERRDWSDDVRRTIIATVSSLTARSVAEAVLRWNPLARPPDVVIAAGGGTHNPTLMRMLEDELGTIPLRLIDDFGIRSELKEALCFAVLAHEFMNETPTGMPSVTGARARAVQGCLCIPSISAEN